MIKSLILDFKALYRAYLGQDLIFYLGCAYIVLVYMRPQLIYPQFNFLPWIQLVILFGLFLQVLKNQLAFRYPHFLVFSLSIVAIFSSFYSEYPNISKRYMLDPMILATEVFFISNCAKNKKQVVMLMTVFFLCMFKMSFFGAKAWAMRGFAFTSWGLSGPPGFFQNSGELSLLMAITAVASIPFFLAIDVKRKYFLLLPITAVMTVLGASSRGSQLSLLAGLFTLLILYRKFSFKNILSVALVLLLGFQLLPEEQKARFQSAGSDDTSTSRLEYWAAGFEMFKENLMLGVGYRAFPEVYHQRYKINDGSFLSNRRERAHNSVVEVASTLGLMGLILYFLMHIYVYVGFSKKYNDHFTIHMNRMFKACIVTYFIGALFMSVAFYPYIFFLLSMKIWLVRLKYLD